MIDLSFSIDELIEEYPYADVIMSRDIDTAPFVSNSGFMIIRCSLWSYRLMDLWWSSYERDRCCDQNAFTWLYDRKVPSDIQDRVVLLKVDAINTNFPAWKNQLNHNPVLHLAGLTSLYRRPVFERGLHVICSHQRSIIDHANNARRYMRDDQFKDKEKEKRNDDDEVSYSRLHRLPPQIGLTREYLQSVMQQLNHRRLVVLETLYQSLPSLINPMNTTIYSNLSIISTPSVQD